MKNMRAEVSADKKTLTLSFPDDGNLTLNFDAKQADELLKSIGFLRSTMTPEIGRDFAPGQKIAAVADPRYMTEPEVMNNDSLLHVRHPGFGWLSFLFPKTEAAKLAHFLQAQADLPPAPPPAKPN